MSTNKKHVIIVGGGPAGLIAAAQLKDSDCTVTIIDQKPTVFSAIKKDGIRMYEHARAGAEIEMDSRKTTIHKFEITRIELPEIDFRVICSKGTYIRSLANDYGKALNSGAYLAVLRRTKIGNFDVLNAISPEEFEKQITAHKTDADPEDFYDLKKL